MKVLNIMLSRNLGGIEQAFIDYSEILKSQSFEVINITSSFAKINRILENSIKLPNFGPWDLISNIYLKFIIYVVKPDMVITHGGRASKFTSFQPHIGVSHNYKIKNLIKCDYVIALTEHMKQYLINNNFIEDRITVCPNMIKIDQEFVYKPLNTPVIIGTCARFVKKKGIDVFLRSLPFLKKEGYIFKALIGGDGEEKNALVTLCNDLGLQQEVSFVGWVSDKQDFFSNIDIFCLPSIHEPFGIIVLEAMKYSVPIISTKTEGPIEILEDKQTALLVNIDSPQELAEAFENLINNPGIAEILAKNAYDKVHSTYDSKVIATKLSRFLLDIK